MKFEIIETGSKGNAVVFNSIILIDCGVPFKRIINYYKNLQLILLTHIHGDHFNKATIKRLAQERPTLRFGCGEWLVKSLVDIGINKSNIDIYQMDTIYDYKVFRLKPFYLIHNVPTCGYKIDIEDKKIIYATDTNTMNHIEAKDYDYYFIEANYTEDEIKERIKTKQQNGVFTYELDVLKNHLSKEKCDNWLYKNMGNRSQYIYMHGHST